MEFGINHAMNILHVVLHIQMTLNFVGSEWFCGKGIGISG